MTATPLRHAALLLSLLAICSIAFIVNGQALDNLDAATTTATDENKPASTITSTENKIDDGKPDVLDCDADKELGDEESQCSEDGPSNSHSLECAGEDESKHQTNSSPPPKSKSNVNSLFNCDLPSSLCTYYYPAKMFKDESLSRIGEKYNRYLQEMEEKRINGTLYDEGMPAVGFPTLTMNHNCLGPDGKRKERKAIRKSVYGEEEKVVVQKPLETSVLGNNIGQYELEEDNVKVRCMTERLSFIHVHKSGGTSLHNIYTAMSRTESASVARHKFYNPRGLAAFKEAEERDIALDSLAHATTYPTAEEGFQSKQHVIFALHRDPTERFISSLKQVISGKGSEKNPARPILKEMCLKPSATPQEALFCIAQYVQTHGFWVELHFWPQVLDIAFTTMYQDVPIAGFSFRDIKTVLDYFGFGDVHASRVSEVRKQDGDDILDSISVDDYTEETMQIVCEIYEVDVVMQRLIGLEVPGCDPYIQRVSAPL